MFGWMKLLTKKGRQEAVRDAAKSYLTPEKLAELLADGVAIALEAGTDKLSDERCSQIAVGCEKGADALKHITAAINPDGEEGKKVSESEKTLIQADIRAAIELIVTKTSLDSIVDKASQYVP